MHLVTCYLKMRVIYATFYLQNWEHSLLLKFSLRACAAYVYCANVKNLQLWPINNWSSGYISIYWRIKGVPWSKILHSVYLHTDFRERWQNFSWYYTPPCQERVLPSYKGLESAIGICTILSINALELLQRVLVAATRPSFHFQTFIAQEVSVHYSVITN